MVGDEEMIAEVKSLSRWNGVGFCDPMLRLVLGKAVVWSQLQE